jgi:GAF domain-containing protein
LNERCPHA